MLKIPQAKLQQYMNRELPDVQAGFRKGRGTRDQIANIHWIMEKAREFKKNIYFCFIDYAKAFDCVDHNKLWKILKEMGIQDHVTCILRNLYTVALPWTAAVTLLGDIYIYTYVHTLPTPTAETTPTVLERTVKM